MTRLAQSITKRVIFVKNKAIMKLTQQQRSQAINEQVNAAKAVGNSNGMVAVVVESKLTSKARNTWFGFHFEKPGAVQIGETYSHTDGSLFTVLHIIDPAVDSVIAAMKGGDVIEYASPLDNNKMWTISAEMNGERVYFYLQYTPAAKGAINGKKRAISLREAHAILTNLTHKL